MGPTVVDLPDELLLERAAAGDEAAYGMLWTRYADFGRRVAASACRGHDPEDLVAEAYVRIFEALSSGKGPSRSFAPYLIVTIKNIAATWSRRAREVPTETLDSIPDMRSLEDPVLAAADASMAAQAFHALPARWQEVLWLTEVEHMTPRQLAPVLNLSPNSVAALIHRAREGLRQQWITQHSLSRDLPIKCQEISGYLGAYARGRLAARNQVKVEAHLSNCNRCRKAAADADEVESRLGLWSGPLAGASIALPTLLSELSMAGVMGFR